MNFLEAKALVSDNMKDLKGKTYLGKHSFQAREGLDLRHRHMKMTRSYTNKCFSLNFQQESGPLSESII